MKRLLLAATASLSLGLAPVPAMAQAEGEDTTEALVAMGETFASIYVSDPLTAEQEARLPAAMAIIDIMMPEGFYAELMGDVMGSAMEPVMGMLSGAGGADLMLSGRLNIDPETRNALSDDQKIELATLLDPGFSKRGTMMQTIMNDMMLDVAVAIEPGFREGMAKAYAVRFDADQLNDIAMFFATPTGEIFARENIKLTTDPQVMSASMQAMPAMMEQFGNLGAELEAAMADLPEERAISDLSDAERARIAQLLNVEAGSLEEVVNPPVNAEDAE